MSPIVVQARAKRRILLPFAVGLNTVSIAVLVWLDAQKSLALKYNNENVDTPFNKESDLPLNSNKSGSQLKPDDATKSNQKELANADANSNLPTDRVDVDSVQPLEGNTNADFKAHNVPVVGSSAFPQILAGPPPSKLVIDVIPEGPFERKLIADSTATESPSVSETNWIVPTGAVTNPAGTLQIDTTAPAVTSVTTSGPGIDGSGNGDLNAGHVVTLTVNLSEAVTVAGGTPTLTLNNGGTASYIGGTGTALSFSYTVGAGQDTGDLAVTSFNLNGATLQDAASNSCQSLRRGDQPGGHLADRHHGAGGDVGDNLRPRDRRQRQRRPQCRPCRHPDRQPERGGDGGRRHADAVAEQWRHGELHRRHRDRIELQLHGRRRSGHRRSGGDVVQPERGNAAGRGKQQCQSLRRGDQSGGHLADRHHGAGGDVGDNLRPRDRRQRQRRPQCRPCRHPDRQPERGGDGGRRHADADPEQWRHCELHRRHRDRIELQLHGRRRSGHRRSGGDVVQPERGNAAGRGEQQCQSLRRGDQSGGHLADRHHGAGGDVGDNLRPRDRRQRQRRPQCRPCRHPDRQPERGGDGGRRHADAVAEQWRHGELHRRHRDRIELQLHGRRRSGHRRSGGDVVQPERGNAAGRGEQQCQSLRRGDQSGGHLADRHHGAGGDVGDNLRPRDRRQRQRRPQCRPCRHPDRQPERGGDGGRRHADAVAEQWRHGELHRRHRDRIELQLHGRRRSGHRRSGGDVVQPERGNAAGRGKQQLPISPAR